MYKTIIFCGVIAFTMAQTANGQTQDNRYLVGSSASHATRILQQDAPTPAPTAGAAQANQAAANVAPGCDTGPAYGSIGCDAAPAAGCGNAACGGCDAGGCGCGVGRNFFNRGGNCGGGDCGCCNSYEYWRTYFGWNDASGLGPAVSPRDGWTTGFALGKREGQTRRELELALRDNSYDSGNVTGSLRNTALMANFLYDLRLLRINDARSYVGAGIGAGYTELEVDGGATGSDTTFAYQFITGMEKPLRNGANAFVEYRYFGTPDANFGGTDVDLHHQSVLFGIQVRK